MKKIEVFAPSTVANVACGFDVLGFAMEGIGDTISISKTPTAGISIEHGKGCKGIPTNPQKNVIGVAVNALLESLGYTEKAGFRFKVSKNVKPGSGLGSSASSSSAAVFGVNELLGNPYTKRDLIKFAMKGEEAASGLPHADNVAPSLLGGFTLVRSYEPLDVVSLTYPESLYTTVVHPQIEVKTSDSKKILKRKVDLRDAITQWGNVGGLVAGLAQSDFGLIGRSLQDVIAEPTRSMLIPLFKEAKEAAFKEGALGASISGSGPSIFALSFSRKIAESIAIAFNNVYASNNILAHVYISKINPIGAEILS